MKPCLQGLLLEIGQWQAQLQAAMLQAACKAAASLRVVDLEEQSEADSL